MITEYENISKGHAASFNENPQSGTLRIAAKICVHKKACDLKGCRLSFIRPAVRLRLRRKRAAGLTNCSTDAEVVQKGFEYLKGFAPETIATAVLFSMLGYFNGTGKTVWVMAQGLIQTLLVRLPMAYIMSIQPNASLTNIGLAAPTSTMVGVILNIAFYIHLNKAKPEQLTEQ